MKKLLEKNAEQCHDCKFIEKMKSTDDSGGSLIQIQPSDIPAVLDFADRNHQGFRGALRRIKPWCDFNGFESKVSPCSSFSIFNNLF